jgi:hypothetical protein
MRSTTAVVFATLLLSASLICSFRQPTFAQARTSESDRISLNTASLNFTNAHVDPFQNNQVIRAFVPTGSRSVNCLATLNESNNAVPGIVLFCGEREPAAFGEVPGMLVSVFFPTPVPPDLVLSVTLYQQGARKYGTPVLCTANDGC